MKNTNTNGFNLETELKYYDSDLGIDGTADELASFAERYTDDYSDEALLKIIEILRGEKKEKNAMRVEFELESRHERQLGKRDLGRLKLWAMDGMYCLIDDEQDGNIELTLINDTKRINHLIMHVQRDSGETATSCISWDEFRDMTADDFEKRMNEVVFYAY